MIIQCLAFILIILNFNLKIFIILDDSDMYAFLNRKELLSVAYYLHSQAKIQQKCLTSAVCFTEFYKCQVT